MEPKPIQQDNRNRDTLLNITRRNSTQQPGMPQSTKQGSYTTGTVSTKMKQRKKEHPTEGSAEKPLPKVQVGNRMRSGVQQIQNSGDFLGRLGTLVTMVVSMISTTVVTVSSFVEGVYWKFGLLAALLLFVHLPVTIALIWMMFKARVKGIYKKVRPQKFVDTETIIIEAEVDDTKETLDSDPASVPSLENKKTKNKKITERNTGTTNSGFVADEHAQQTKN
ncbi:hypothetical protein EGW08_007181 [Elysia chlorotica]|uniref:Uncharacterized protein n=1 Tax=Elysia chlorotica TaxID=188477 RepID=A0A433TU09_ELYCH|nr:hypothetical protein EGW08_007181 [Elysia chlorotica]